MKKRNAKRLTKLRVTEVSAVDRGAAVGAHVVLMKRDAGKKRRIAGFNSAGDFVDRNGVPSWRWKGGSVAKLGDIDPVAKAQAEIEANRAVAKAAAPIVKEFTTMQTQTQIAKAAEAVVQKFDARVGEIATRHSITRDAALLKIASSREDGALWRSYREAQQVIAETQPAPVAAPASVMVGPAVAKMDARVAEILKSDLKITSVESAIAKVATSALPGDQALWREYKTASAGGETMSVAKDMSGAEMARIAFANLCIAVRASYPGLTDGQVRAWASKIQRKGPPKGALQQLTADAA